MIEQINVNDIPKRNIRYLDIVRDIEEFLSMNCDAAEIKFPKGRRSASIYSSYRKQIVNGNYSAKVVQRSDRVFLLRKDVNI